MIFFPDYFHFLHYFLSAQLGIKLEHEVFVWCFNTEAPRAQLTKVILSEYNTPYNRVGFLVVKVVLGRDFLRLRLFSCQYYSAGRSYSFILLPLEVYNIRN